MVVGVVMLVMGGLYIRGLHNYVIELSDERLANSLTAFSHSLSKINQDEPHTRLLGAQGPDMLMGFTGQSDGTLIAVLHDGKVAGSAVFGDDEPRTADAATVADIERRTWTDKPFTADLAGLGRYRLRATRSTATTS